MNTYILEGKTPVRCDDIIKWSEWGHKNDTAVAKEAVGDIRISTVFLGMDTTFLKEELPLLFETMIFGGEHDKATWRYATWKEAEAGHAKAVKKVKKGTVYE